MSTPDARDPLDPLGAALLGAAAAAASGLGAVISAGPAVGLAVAGLLALPFGLAAALARAARLAPGGGAPSALGRGLPFALAAGALALAGLGAVLKATTHHRALGGTTFAIAAALVGVGLLAFGARLGALLGRLGPRPSAAASHLGTGLLALALLFLLARGGLLRLEGLDAATLLAALGAGAFVAPGGGWSRGAARAGLAASVGLCVAGAGLVLTSPEIARAVAGRGYLAGALTRSVTSPPVSAPGAG